MDLIALKSLRIRRQFRFLAAGFKGKRQGSIAATRMNNKCAKAITSNQ